MSSEAPSPSAGTPEYRNGPWYKAPHGKKQGDSMGAKRRRMGMARTLVFIPIGLRNQNEVGGRTGARMQ